MSERTIIKLKTHHRIENDGTHTLVLAVTQLASMDEVNIVSTWLHDLVLMNAHQLGELYKNAATH